MKAHLSRYMDAVKAGEEVIVTERGRPVARLSPVVPIDGTGGRVARLVREGRMRAPTHAPVESPGVAGVSDPDGRSLEALLEERAEGR